jgi:hemerythrin superfamily protein
MGMISQLMKEDHKNLFENYKKLMQAASCADDKSQGALSKLLLEIKRHFSLEEMVLFPIVEQRTHTHSLNDKNTSILRQDHTNVLGMMKKLDENVRSGKFDDSIREEIGKIMRNHAEIESNIVYPWIDEVLTDDESQDIVKRMKSFS